MSNLARVYTFIIANTGCLSARFARAVHFLVFTSLVSACAQSPAPSRIAGLPRLEHLAEPGAREVVVVINANSFAGSHAGMFAGSRLYDPSGTYAGVRSEDSAWRHPSLDDYVKYHLRDGPDVRIYRFHLAQAEFNIIRARIENAGWSMPMFCARDVSDVLAGVGQFKRLEAGRWTSPVRLGERLKEITPTTLVPGACGAPGAQPC